MEVGHRVSLNWDGFEGHGAKLYVCDPSYDITKLKNLDVMAAEIDVTDPEFLDSALEYGLTGLEGVVAIRWKSETGDYFIGIKLDNPWAFEGDTFTHVILSIPGEDFDDIFKFQEYQ